MVGQLDFQQLMDNRDLDLNCAFVTKDGIVFSQAAYLAAQTARDIPRFPAIFGRRQPGGVFRTPDNLLLRLEHE